MTNVNTGPSSYINAMATRFEPHLGFFQANINIQWTTSARLIIRNRMPVAVIHIMWMIEKKQLQETVHSTVLLCCFYLLYML